MPFAADVDRFAPPARAVVVPAAENVPTVRTTVWASALKSVGRFDGVVEVAGIPIPSKVWVYDVTAGIEMAANAEGEAHTSAATAASATRRKSIQIALLR